MSAAFAEACKTLHVGTDNSARAMVARTIIALIEEGATDADRLAAVAIDEMRGAQEKTA